MTVDDETNRVRNGSPTASRSGTRRVGRSGVRARGLHWRDATLGLVLSLIPGFGHFHAGETRRAVLWAVVFLVIVVPLACVGFVVWSFSFRAPAIVAAVVVAATLLVGLGPAVRVLRRGVSYVRAPDGSLRPRPSPQGRTVFGAVVLCLFAAELIVGAVFFLDRAAVSSGRLAPAVRRGENVLVAVSTYIRPVHGDVVLLAPTGGSDSVIRQASRIDPSPHARHLARVLACPRDRVELQTSRVVVNGITLRASGPDQRRDLEKAGRRLRRYSVVSDLFRDSADVPRSFWRAVPLAGADWQLVVPDGYWLVVPDVVLPDVADDGGEPTPLGWLVARSEVLGRVVLWAR